MKRCPDNQINASFIDISRIKWLVFLLRSSFFCTTSTVASSEAPADYRPAPSRTDSIQERHQRQCILICLYKFVAGTSMEQVMDKGIRQKIYKRVNSFIDGSAFCLGAPKHVRSDSEKHKCHSHMWCVDMAPGQNGMHVKTSADRRLKQKLRV